MSCGANEDLLELWSISKSILRFGAIYFEEFYANKGTDISGAYERQPHWKDMTRTNKLYLCTLRQNHFEIEPIRLFISILCVG